MHLHALRDPQVMGTSQRYGGDCNISCLPNGRWACILLVRVLRDAVVQGAHCAFTFSRHGPLFRGLALAYVHSALAHTIRQQLAPQIERKYVARLEIRSLRIRIQQPKSASCILMWKSSKSGPAVQHHQKLQETAWEQPSLHRGSLNDSIATSPFDNSRNSRCGPEYPGDRLEISRPSTNASHI